MPAPVLGPIGDLGAHARLYAAAGLEVFPADARTKAPLTDHGLYDAATDLAVIDAWWARWPGALIAHRIAPDQLLLDVDPRHGGVEVWMALKEAMGGELPVTRIHRSGRGDLGMHFWWLRPADRISTKKLDTWAKEHGLGQQLDNNRWTCGIDPLHHTLRYTILPPSPHPATGKPYQWHDGRGLEVPPAPLPALLADLLVADEPTPSTWTPAATDPDSIADWYSAHHGFVDVLGAHGWKVVAGDGNSDGSRWRHPQATAAHSATIRHGCLFVFSTNTPFEPTGGGEPHGYTPFRAWATLEHGGDLQAAGRAARQHRNGFVGDDLAWIKQAAAQNGQTTTSAQSEPGEEKSPKDIPWPEMPPQALHGLFGETVTTLEPHTEADPAGILASLLAYFGAAVGPAPHFRLSGTIQTARVNVLLVGDSARARKGTAEAMARWVMRTADPAITGERRATGLNSGEGLIDAVRDPRWGRDKNGNEVLVDAGVDDKRLLIFEPEFAGRLLTAIKRSGSTISALLRMAWDDGNLQTMSRNPQRATGAHVCVIGNATMDELLNGISVDDLAGGLLNRFLFVAVRSGRRLPFGGRLDDGIIEELGQRFRDCLQHGRQRGRITFAADCEDTWPAAYDALMDDAPPGPLGHLTARGPVQVQRLALTYALADGATQIGCQHLAAGVAFWSYCRDSAQLIFTGDVAGRVTGDIDGDQLLKLLVDSGQPWSVMEIRDHFGWSGTKEAGVRARLEKLGLVKVVQVPKEGGGRPRTVVVAR